MGAVGLRGYYKGCWGNHSVDCRVVTLLAMAVVDGAAKDSYPFFS